jgi:hypothetical protein
VALDRKNPPFAEKREGWGTLMFIREVAIEKTKEKQQSANLGAQSGMTVPLAGLKPGVHMS